MLFRLLMFLPRYARKQNVTNIKPLTIDWSNWFCLLYFSFQPNNLIRFVSIRSALQWWYNAPHKAIFSDFWFLCFRLVCLPVIVWWILALVVTYSLVCCFFFSFLFAVWFDADWDVWWWVAEHKATLNTLLCSICVLYAQNEN